MPWKNKVAFAVSATLAALAAPLFWLYFSGHIVVTVSETGAVAPAALPAPPKLTLIFYLPLTAEGEVVGGVAVYDDATTGKPREYTEIYDAAGRLLGVSWYDRFGILRNAVDRGVILEKNEIEGILVLVFRGEFI